MLLNFLEKQLGFFRMIRSFAFFCLRKDVFLGRTSPNFLQLTWKKRTPQVRSPKTKLVGGFNYFLFSPLFGEMIQVDQYFSIGLKPPTRKTTHMASHGVPDFFTRKVFEVSVSRVSHYHGPTKYTGHPGHPVPVNHIDQRK